MTKVERDNGFIEDGTGAGCSIYTVTVDGDHQADADQLDRILQFVLVELGIDTSWQVPPPPPDPENHPPVIPENPPNPDPLPEGPPPVFVV